MNTENDRAFNTLNQLIDDKRATIQRLEQELAQVRADYDAQYKAHLDAEARWARQVNDLQRQLEMKYEEMNEREAFHVAVANNAERRRVELARQLEEAQVDKAAKAVVEALRVITLGAYKGPTEEELLLRITRGEMQAAKQALRNYEAGL